MLAIALIAALSASAQTSSVKAEDWGACEIVPASAQAFVLEVTGISDGAAVSIGKPAAAANQKWTITPNGEKFFAIKPLANATLALAVSKGETKSGSAIVLEKDSGQPWQLWALTKHENGDYSISPSHVSEMGLNLFGGKQTPGAKIDLGSDKGVDSHLQWMIRPLAARDGETLYNGITLPDVWPPRVPVMKAGEPMPVPYLEHPPALITIDIGRQLFTDDFLIEKTTMKREHHLATEYEGNPVLKPETDVEHEGKSPMAMPFSDGVWFDPKDQLFKMWYLAGYGKQTGYATSRDGLKWDRPQLDVRAGTNVVQTGARDSSTVWLDLEERDPQRRYKMFRGHSENNQFGLSVYFSPDGIHWGERVLRTGSTGDRTTVFWNPFRKVWVYSTRHGWGVPRTRRYWEVKDILSGPQWAAISEPVMWTGSDRLDPPREDLQETPQLYNLDAVAYESVMVGLFTIWHGDKNIPAGRPKPNSIFLGYSRDGYHWDRPDRRPFIPVSEKEGDWNWGNVQSVGGGFLVNGDKLWFYHSGRAGSGPTNRDGNGSTGIAFLRRDGFVSMNAKDEAMLTTRTVKFSGKHLFVNVDAPAGELRAEVLDKDGNVIAPFTKENSAPVTADTTRAAVKWRGADDLSKLAQQPVKFRFTLREGAIYAFWVSPDASGASQGYVAAGGPGFSGPTDTVGK